MTSNTKTKQEKGNQKPGNSQQRKQPPSSTSPAGNNNQTAKPQQSPSGAALSLPSKPKVTPSPSPTPKPLVWSAIVAKKSDDSKERVSTTSTTETSSINSASKQSNSSAIRKDSVPVLDSEILQTTKKSKSPTPSGSSAGGIKEHQPLNNFNSEDVFNYLSKKSAQLKQKATVFKDSGSAWVVKPIKSKKDPKVADDVVSSALGVHVKKVNKKEYKEHSNNNQNKKEKAKVESKDLREVKGDGQ